MKFVKFINKREISDHDFLKRIEFYHRKKHKKKKDHYDNGRIAWDVKYFRENMTILSVPNRISELRRLASLKINNTVPYMVRRKRYFRAEGPCLVCREWMATCQHHIVMLINGGSNKPYNRIMICDHCHSQVHSWMNFDQNKLKPFVPDEIKNMDYSFQQTIK